MRWHGRSATTAPSPIRFPNPDPDPKAESKSTAKPDQGGQDGRVARAGRRTRHAWLGSWLGSRAAPRAAATERSDQLGLKP